MDACVMEEKAEAVEDNNDDQIKSEDEDDEPHEHKTPEDLAFLKQLLDTKLPLPNNSTVSLFSYGPPKEGCARKFICHLCPRGMFDRISLIKEHIMSTRHQDYLKKNNLSVCKKPFLMFMGREEFSSTLFKIFAGENIETITDAYKNRLIVKSARRKRPAVEPWKWKQVSNQKLKTELSQDGIYKYNQIQPVLGLDYIVKMRKDAHWPQIVKFCALCRQELRDSIYSHIITNYHQMKYIKRHFADMFVRVSIRLVALKNEKEKGDAIRAIFRKLYRQIEMKLGFKEFHIVYAVHFQRSRDKYFNAIDKLPHYCENSIKFYDDEIEDLLLKCNQGFQIIDPDPVQNPFPDEESAVGYVGQKNTTNKPAPMRTRSRNAGDNDRCDDLQERWNSYRNAKDHLFETMRRDFKRYEEDFDSLPLFKKKLAHHFSTKKGAKKNRAAVEARFRRRWPDKLQTLFISQFNKRRDNLRLKFNLPTRVQTPGPGEISNDLKHQSGGGMNFERQTHVAEVVTVVTVLQQLSVLVKQLGSFGPKCIQLLDEAVLFERNNRNANDLLATDEYYAFFATVKELFMGKILGNLVSAETTNDVNRAIRNLTQLLNSVDSSNNNRDEDDGGCNQYANQSGGNNYYSNFDDNRNSNTNTRFEDFGNNDYFRGNNDVSNYRDDFRNDNTDKRMNTSFRDSNSGGKYRNDDSGNFSSSNYGGNNPDNNNFRGGMNNFNDSGNNCSTNSGRNTNSGYNRGYLDDNFSSNDNFRDRTDQYNAPGSDRAFNSVGGNSGSNTMSGYKKNYRGNDFSENYGNSSAGRTIAGSSSSNYASNTNQYESSGRSAGNYGNSNNLNSMQEIRNNSASTGGNWMGGSSNSSKNYQFSTNNTTYGRDGNNSGRQRNASNFSSGGGGGYNSRTLDRHN